MCFKKVKSLKLSNRRRKQVYYRLSVVLNFIFTRFECSFSVKPLVIPKTEIPHSKRAGETVNVLNELNKNWMYVGAGSLLG